VELGIKLGRDIIRTNLEIVGLYPGLGGELSEFFREIVAAGEDALFHPHAFTSEEAERLCNYAGKDHYYAIRFGNRMLGYGMLRGWDEGYEVPSLGIFIRREARGRGLGKLFMLHLHAASLLAGSKRIRVKVYEHNLAAKGLYESLGYIFSGREGSQFVGFLDLSS
jgi:[ribosomal protein S18]-alanine N-acetyltransferase